MYQSNYIIPKNRRVMYQNPQTNTQNVQAQADKWICPKCQKETSGKFCPECGTKKPCKFKCPKCGYELDEKKKFCPECGNQIEE